MNANKTNNKPRINTTFQNMHPSTNTRNISSGRVNTSTPGYSGSNVFGIVLLVVVILLVAGASYWAYSVYSSRVLDTTVSVEALPDVKDAQSKFAIGSGSIPNSRYSNEYSISMWLNIRDYSYNYGKEKVILRRGTAGSSNLEIVLDATQNDLIVRVRKQGAPLTSTLTVSQFANIEKVNNPIDINTRYISGTAGNPFNNVQTIGVLTDISSNEVDYPTIKYDITGGCDNALTTMKPDDAMTIMIDQNQYTTIKEGFINSVADNCAPLESQVLDNNYFSMVSGNTIIPNNQTERYSNIPNLNNNTNTEKFDTTTATTKSATTVPATTIPSTIVPATTAPATTQPQTANCLLDANLNADPTVGTCVYKMIPLQKWVHVIVSVYNQIVDIYIDGQLASSCVLKGFPAISTDDVNITPDGGFSGQIARIAFSNTAMTVSKAQSLYYDGPVPSTNIFTMIPNWIWYSIILIIVIVIVYSIVM